MDTIFLFGPAASGKSTFAKFLSKNFASMSVPSLVVNDSDFIKIIGKYYDPESKKYSLTSDGGMAFHDNFILDMTTRFIVRNFLKIHKKYLKIIEMARGDSADSPWSSYKSTWKMIPSDTKRNSSIIYIKSKIEMRLLRNGERRKKGEHFCPDSKLKLHRKDDFDEKLFKKDSIDIFKVENNSSISELKLKAQEVASRMIGNCLTFSKGDTD
ncbi:MAG: deoxynucleoside kinase [Candidatus Dojkabacteria bacterium]|nr:deoxynucleoside kinase [Candidatus Dojkabacteria bacterium]